nr:LysM peptidoglycan-binding domain-containing protein [Bacillota bacterium]
MDYEGFERQCPAGTSSYIVQSGDTPYKIAGKLNTTVTAILSANTSIIPENLEIGQSICKPQPQPPAAVCPIGTSPYEIKSGDILASIARRFDTTVEAIQSA